MNRYAAQSDEELFALLKDGDEGLFTELYDRYWEGLFKYIKTFVQDEELTKDLVQNVFFGLWQQRETLTISTSLNDYIYRAARNSVFKHFRAERTHKKYEAHFTHFMVAYDNSSVEALNLADLNASIERSISQLPEYYQTAFRLSRYEQIPNEEIAKRMNISKRAVENYITTALKHLRGSLGEFMVLVWWLSDFC